MSTFVERISFVQNLRMLLLFVCLGIGAYGCIIETHGEDADVDLGWPFRVADEPSSSPSSSGAHAPEEPAPSALRECEAEAHEGALVDGIYASAWAMNAVALGVDHHRALAHSLLPSVIVDAAWPDASADERATLAERYGVHVRPPSRAEEGRRVWGEALLDGAAIYDVCFAEPGGEACVGADVFGVESYLQGVEAEVSVGLARFLEEPSEAARIALWWEERGPLAHLLEDSRGVVPNPLVLWVSADDLRPGASPFACQLDGLENLGGLRLSATIEGHVEQPCPPYASTRFSAALADASVVEVIAGDTQEVYIASLQTQASGQVLEAEPGSLSFVGGAASGELVLRAFGALRAWVRFEERLLNVPASWWWDCGG